MNPALDETLGGRLRQSQLNQGFQNQNEAQALQNAVSDLFQANTQMCQAILEILVLQSTITTQTWSQLQNQFQSIANQSSKQQYRQQA